MSGDAAHQQRAARVPQFAPEFGGAHGAAYAFRRSGVRQVGEADWSGDADAGTDRRGGKVNGDRPGRQGQKRDAARGQQEP